MEDIKGAAMISANKNRMAAYAGDGVTDDFIFDFPVTASTDLEVYAITAGVSTLLALVTDYTVSLDDDGSAGGTVTLLAPDTAAPSGTDILIIRNVPLTQLTNLIDASAMPADSIELRLDMIYMALQRITEELARCVKLPITSSTTDIQLAQPSAGKGIKWDANGNLINTTEDLV